MPKNSSTLVRQIFDCLVAGEEPKEIATKLKVSIPTVYNIKNDESISYVLEQFDFCKCFADVLRIGKELMDLPSIATSIKYMMAVTTAEMAGHLNGTGKVLIDAANKIMQVQQALLLEIQISSLRDAGKGIKSLDSPDESDLKKQLGRAPYEITKSESSK